MRTDVNIESAYFHDQITAKLYDPLGLLSPFTITTKTFCQDLCAKKVNWDVTLTEKAKEKCSLFHNHLKSLNQVRVARWYFNGHMQPIYRRLAIRRHLC